MKSLVAASLIAAASMPSVASAQGPLHLVPGDTAGNPHWIEWPNGDQMADRFPAAARRRGLSGRASINCRIKDDGHVFDCSVIPGAEAPENEGFGEAAVQLAPFFRMASDRPVGGSTVVIPIILLSAPGAVAPMPKDGVERRLDALRSALDPAAAPPLVEPVFGKMDGRLASLAPIGAYFPDLAYRQRVAGMAVVRCSVGAEQRLQGCVRMGDAPLDFGFGEAAAKMAADGYMRAPAGQAEGSEVRIAVKFPKP